MTAFKRDLSDDELKELVRLGDQMAASMRDVSAAISGSLGEIAAVKERLKANGGELPEPQLSYLAASLNLVSGSVRNLQASLKIVEDQARP